MNNNNRLHTHVTGPSTAKANNTDCFKVTIHVKHYYMYMSDIDSV